MERYSIADAKAHLSELVDRAEAGETVEITRRGHLVAKVVPVERQIAKLDVDRLRKFTATLRPAKVSAVETIREDARY